MHAPSLSLSDYADPVNARILAVSEDRIAGFEREPFQAIARGSGVPVETVLERIAAMLAAGTIRRVRQTLIATNLAEGALVAWRVPEARLQAAFDFILANDPFTGHVVLRSAEPGAAGAEFRLWTTLKVPAGVSLEAHCALLGRRIGSEDFRLMPALGVFALGVGHMRRLRIAPGQKTPRRAVMVRPRIVRLDALEWRVLLALKREFTVEEIRPNPWEGRAREAGVSLELFCAVAQTLADRGVMGRFSTFLEHVKPAKATGRAVTQHNGLFHWTVPAGREEEAGGEIGRHEILTHCYWREGGPAFGHANIMAVCHGTSKERTLEHKAAIDAHLAACGIPVRHSTVFWGERSEIKPSEISPELYREWLARMGD
ncbi:MAG: Lrp/AsnC family transcriptional regulator [Chthoniobacteraceae bacterium]|nr:Lrp/AsnC family transcriptional regulator [Chthoniobacteraceae bacterium]